VRARNVTNMERVCKLEECAGSGGWKVLRSEDEGEGESGEWTNTTKLQEHDKLSERQISWIQPQKSLPSSQYGRDCSKTQRLGLTPRRTQQPQECRRSKLPLRLPLLLPLL